jgi:septal ring factor EnvC (AmiA/AmiB activator)
VLFRSGLIDVLWYGLKYLFGTADARDVKRLTAICDELHMFETRITHAVDNQLTYIRALDETTRQNAEDIAKLAKTLRSSMEGLSTQYNRVEADLLDTQKIIERQMRYSAAIREIEMAILEIRFSIT